MSEGEPRIEVCEGAAVDGRFISVELMNVEIIEDEDESDVVSRVLKLWLGLIMQMSQDVSTPGTRHTLWREMMKSMRAGPKA